MYLCVWHVFVCVTCICVCDMYLCVWHVFVCVTCSFTRQADSFICVTWLIHMCDMTHSCVRHDSFKCMQMCDLTHSNVCHDSFHSVMCDMTHSNTVHIFVFLYVWHHSPTVRLKSFICVTRHRYVCDMTHPYVTCRSHVRDVTHTLAWHDSFICVTWLIHIRDRTNLYARYNTCTHSYVFYTFDMKQAQHITHVHFGISFFDANSFIHIHMRDMTHICDMNRSVP